jgi:hypothetical protein
MAGFGTSGGEIPGSSSEVLVNLLVVNDTSDTEQFQMCQALPQTFQNRQKISPLVFSGSDGYGLESAVRKKAPFLNTCCKCRMFRMC